MKLTIGIPHFNDYDGWWFTVSSLFEHHSHNLHDVDLLTVDNSPNTEQGEEVRASCGQWPGMRYVSQETPVGTATAKDRVFAEALGDIVLCLDSHVLLGPLAFRAIERTFSIAQSPTLLHGPLAFDGTATVATHLNSEWGSGMPGQWVRGWIHPCGTVLAPRRVSATGGISWETITAPIEQRTECSCGELPRVAWHGHEAYLRAAGWVPIDERVEHYDIGAHGTGLFACQRWCWPKFCAGDSSSMSGFGCEEWHLHDLWRDMRGRVVFDPFLRWRHRFRQKHHEYRPALLDQGRNAILWSRRLGRDPSRLRKHFPRIDATEWRRLEAGERIVESPRPASPANAAPPPCRLVGLNVIAKLASSVGVIDPQGIAFPCVLRAGAKAVEVSVERYPSVVTAVDAAHSAVRSGTWGHQTFTAHFSDSDRQQSLRHELMVFANVAPDRRDALLTRVIASARWVAITPKPSIVPAPLADWHQVETSPASEFAFFAMSAEFWIPEFLGPGTQLQWLIAELGLGDGSACSACNQRAAEMDAWGVAGCEAHRETILGWLRSAAAEAGIVAKLRAAAKLPAAALLEPCDWLLTEAIRRSREGLKATA